MISKVLPRLISEHWRRIGFEQRPNLAIIRDLCREMDLLHPQVDDEGKRPDNVEYPCQTENYGIQIPATWRFVLAPRLYTNSGKLLLKAAMRLTREPAIFISNGPL